MSIITTVGQLRALLAGVSNDTVLYSQFTSDNVTTYAAECEISKSTIGVAITLRNPDAVINLKSCLLRKIKEDYVEPA